MSITYGRIVFDGPYPLENYKPPYRAGIYALMKPNPLMKPKPYEILYFGESGNLSERDIGYSHHKYNCWLQNAGLRSNLYIGFYLMPNSTEQQRLRIESELIIKYRPPCND